VAPVTRTIRAIPTEIALGSDHDVAVDCVAAFDNLQPIRRSFLTERVGSLLPHGSGEICRALAALADC
jgi:mRNA interferase MazF